MKQVTSVMEPKKIMPIRRLLREGSISKPSLKKPIPITRGFVYLLQPEMHCPLILKHLYQATEN